MNNRNVSHMTDDELKTWVEVALLSKNDTDTIQHYLGYSLATLPHQHVMLRLAYVDPTSGMADVLNIAIHPEKLVQLLRGLSDVSRTPHTIRGEPS